MKVSISICPTHMELEDGSRYDEGKLLEAIRDYVTETLGDDAVITCLQVGCRQGDWWNTVDGDADRGGELMDNFYEDHGSDENLFVPDVAPVEVEIADMDETIRECAGLYDFAGLEHPAMAEACRAYHSAAADWLDRDRRAGRLEPCCPGERRILHSQWCGAKFAYSCGAIGVMNDTLTDDEKAAISAADDAGREAARKVIEESDAAVASGE